MLIVRMEFRAQVDGEVLQALINYGELKDGTRYVSKATVQVPSTQVNATVETSDYLPQGG